MLSFFDCDNVGWMTGMARTTWPVETCCTWVISV